MSAAHPLSNIQQELLKLYSSDIAEADLLHIKRYLAKYFAFKAIGDADAIWDQKGYTNETRDADDNKFVDCYMSAGAHYLISHDSHFAILKTTGFPRINLVSLGEIESFLKSE